MAKKKLHFVADTDGTISKSAARDIGKCVLESLVEMLNPDGTFKNTAIQAKFEAWKQSPEGMKYA